MMHKGIKTLLIFCLLLCGCKSQNIEKTKPKKATKELSAEQKLDQKVNQWIDSHGLEEQVLQMFMITPEALLPEVNLLRLLMILLKRVWNNIQSVV